MSMLLMQVCSFCPINEIASTCPRCERPLCLEHMTMPGARCNSCEIEFETQKDELRGWTWFFAAFAAVWIGYALAVGPVMAKYPGFQGGPIRAFSTGFASVDLAIFAAFMSYAAGKTALWARLRALRRKFLAAKVSS